MSEQLLWVGFTQLVGTHLVAEAVIRTVLTIGAQGREADTLVALGIVTGLQRQTDKLVVALRIGLGMVDIVTQELQRSGHVLVETAQRHTRLVIADTHAVVASQLIKGFLDVIGRASSCADIVKIISCNLQLLAIFTAYREDEREIEEVVGGVLLVEYLGAVLHLDLA